MILAVCLFVCQLTTALVAEEFSAKVVSKEWTMFKKTHQKFYATPEEEKYRMGIYLKNKEYIEEHNLRFQKGHVTFTMKMNHFGDMLPHEVAPIKSGFNGTSHKLNTPFRSSYHRRRSATIPESLDWRERGAVSHVKNQKGCGGCWAFSVTGCLEGQVFRKTGKLFSLSEQNLLDCSKGYHTGGCDGGLFVSGFQYVTDNHGINTESMYPFEEAVGECRYNPALSVASAQGFVDIPADGDEDVLKEAVATIGPISVGMDASQISLNFYSGGVYYDQDCSSKDLGHAVLAVGYGSENGEDYWLVKNSWGDQWGEGGYLKLARNKNNHCGLASVTGYILV